jgi:tetratricopeptide (TPR) repeat protein
MTMGTILRCAAAALLLGAAPSWAAPYRPVDEGAVLERLPVVVDATAFELRRLRARAAADPADPAAALALAERYLALGQRTQDPRHVGHARAVVERWWTDPEAPAELLVLRAAIKQNRHEFDAALADLDRALALDVGSPRAWALRATILLVQGKPQESAASCARLERSGTSIAGAVCHAAAMARLGQARAAMALLGTTVESSPGLDPPLEAWARTELAELALLLGDAGAAERELRAALRAEPGDAFTIIALADLLLDQDRPEEALALVRDDPRHDGKLLRSAIALKALGQPAWREQAGELEARFAAAAARGDALHLREEARFRLSVMGEPARALELARENWRQQREPWDARVLLEGALAAGQPAEAGAVVAWLAETGFVDPRLEPALRRLRGGEG